MSDSNLELCHYGACDDSAVYCVREDSEGSDTVTHYACDAHLQHVLLDVIRRMGLDGVFVFWCVKLNAVRRPAASTPLFDLSELIYDRAERKGDATAEQNPPGVCVPKNQIRCDKCGAWRNATEARCLISTCRASSA